MTRRSRTGTAVVLLLLPALMATGCGEDKKVTQPAGAVPTFALTDVNPNSARFNNSVSPRDYLDQVSAWYFGHAT